MFPQSVAWLVSQGMRNVFVRPRPDGRMMHQQRYDEHPTSLTVPSRSRPRPENWQPAWLQAITDDDPIDISVCIANWNCKDYLRACLESLHDFPQGVRVETIVVDNASTDGATDMLVKDFPEVILIRNAENRGFAKASNQAAAKAQGKYVFFLNNDTVVPAQTLCRLFDFAEAHPEVGMIGPRLRDPSGHLQISYRQQPTIFALLHRTMLFRWTGLLKRAYYRYRRNGFESQNVRQVEVLMGAAVLMRRDFFNQMGQWDEDFRFGGEDIELSTRVSKHKPLVYVPGIEIIHHGRISSRLNVAFAAPNVAIGYVRYFRKTGANRFAILMYKLAVTLDAPIHMTCKLAEYGWRLLTQRSKKANKSWLIVQGLWQFLSKDLGRFWRS